MSSSRSCHASEAQFEALVDILAQEPFIARGHKNTPCAKIKYKKFWEELAPRLNILGGATKDGKKWMKYWTDKKNSIKRKAASRAAARRRTGGGVEEICELTEVEERVVHLLGGESYAVGDHHLRIENFQQSGVPTATRDTQHTPSPPAPRHTLQNNEPQSPLSFAIPEPEGEIYTPYRNTQSTLQPGSADLALSPTRRPQTLPRGSTNVLTNRQPPSQRRSNLTKCAEHFVRLEERRLALEEQQVHVNRMMAQGITDMAAAVRALGDGNQALADAIRDGVKQIVELGNQFVNK